MMAVSSLPRSEPDATSSRSRSPDDRWVKPYFSTIFSHCVPLPLPGPPVTGKTFTIFTVHKRSLGQGNVFTPVYHSVHIEGSASRGVLHPRILRDTVNEWAVCILLECILVFFLHFGGRFALFWDH